MSIEPNMMNLGCGPDLKEGWDNVDIYRTDASIMAWDARVPLGIEPRYDFILVNHVLCTMDHLDVDKVLTNLYEILKPGGYLQVIDMDIDRAFWNYVDGNASAIPAMGRTIDEQLCNHISGFGTRKSLYTNVTLTDLLKRHNFTKVKYLPKSEYDLRPGESLIVEAMK